MMKPTRTMVGIATCGALLTATAAPAVASAPTDYDSSFGTGGLASVPAVSSGFSVGDRLAIDGSGNVVVAGSTVTPPASSTAPSTVDVDVARFTSAGVADQTFGTAGQTKTTLGAYATVTGLAIGSAGILVASPVFSSAPNPTSTTTLPTKSYLLRYSTAGAPDTSYGNNGQVTLDTDVVAVALDGSGDALAIGRSLGTQTISSSVMRLTPAGAPDTSFGSNGTFQIPPPGLASAVAVLSDGHILVAGSSGGQEMLWRLTAAGALDSSFGTGGSTVVAVPPGRAASLIPAADGSVIGVETRVAATTVFKTTAAGVLDQAFGDAGAVDITVLGRGFLPAGAVDSSGNITIGGAGGVTGMWVARLHPDGTLDRTFGPNGRFEPLPPSGVAFIANWGPTLQTDGKLLVPGAVASGSPSDPSLSLGAARLAGGSGMTVPPANTVTRISGPDRIATAIAVSHATFDDAAGADATRVATSDVVLAASENYPDALVGTPLAADLGAPLLLTHSAALDAPVMTEIQRVLGPASAGGTVTILGGTLAVSSAVEQALVSAGYAVSRIAGATRYETAVDVAQKLAVPTMLEATGIDFPDGVTAGAAGAHVGAAVLLTQGSTQASATATFLQAHPNYKTYAIGGAAATADPQATAIAGADRWETAVKVADAFFHTPVGAAIATGAAYPDALAGGSRAAELGEPVLLTDPSIFPSSLNTYLQHNASWIDAADVFGGQLAVSDAVATQVKQAITEP